MKTITLDWVVWQKASMKRWHLSCDLRWQKEMSQVTKWTMNIGGSCLEASAKVLRRNGLGWSYKGARVRVGPNLGHRVCLEPALSKDNLGPGVLSLHQASRSLSHLLPPRASHPFLIRMQILMDYRVLTKTTWEECIIKSLERSFYLLPGQCRGQGRSVKLLDN